MMTVMYWIGQLLLAVIGVLNCWQGETLEGIGWFILAWLMYIAELLEKRT